MFGSFQPQDNTAVTQHTKLFSMGLFPLGRRIGCGKHGLLPNAIFFMWLVEHNRCWTTDRLAKRGMDHPEHFSLCDQCYE
jgi:hypothetical protein